MSELPRSLTLLRRVRNRLRVAALGRRVYLSFFVVCGLYAAVLLTSRLLGVVPDWFDPLTLGVLPAAALLLGLLIYRRPTPVEAARAVDLKSGTKDLFLTVTLLEGSAGEYQPLVLRDAELRAPHIRPVEVVPFDWGRRLATVGLAVLLLAAGVLYLPQLDPFGQVQAAAQDEEQAQELLQSRKETETRTAQLKKEDIEGENSDEVKKAVEELKGTLKAAKPVEMQANSKALTDRQKEIGEKWRKLSAEKLKELMSQSTSMTQKFGGAENEKLQKWTKELQEGSTESVQKELEQLKEDLQQLARTDDPVKKAELERQIKKSLRDLQEFASDKVNSKPLAAALERAMKQLQMADNKALSDDALKSVQESLDLSDLELKEIAQSAKDLKSLEEALQTLQMAKQLNEREKLDGEACEACNSLKDYQELYAQMMAGLPMEGDGLGNEGIGRGDVAPEDDSVETDFKVEQSKSPVTAGKVLLSMKTKGMSDSGEAVKEYTNLLQTVKQGVSEAIEQEQIPPGYHQGIKSYFDTIEKGVEPGIGK